MTVSELLQKFRAGTTTPSDALAEAREVIAEKDTEVHAYLELYDDASETAAHADSVYRAGSAPAPLQGVPVALKNNILVRGRRATGGSRILESYTAAYDATVVAKLRDAGAVLVGSTNLDEFAMGSSTEHSAFGATKNPLDHTRVPGGSSGGAAAAVAMGSVPVAIGTDTGGSIRQPASYCGLVGLKPTYGAVSRYGLMAMGSSLDQAGPLAHTVADVARVHEVLAGPDKCDGTTIKADTYPPVPTRERYTIGVPRHFLREGIDPDVAQAFERHLEEVAAAGHTVVDVSVPMLEKGLAAYYVVVPAEVSSNLARYDGMRYGNRVAGEDLYDEYVRSRAAGFGAEAKRRILLGTFVLSAGYYDAYYRKAEAVRELMRAQLAETFRTVDMLVTPTTPTPAFQFGAKADPLSMYRQDIFTVPVNLTGVPALSIPALAVSRGDHSLPVGVQYIAAHGGEARLFDFGERVYDNRAPAA